MSQGGNYQQLTQRKSLKLNFCFRLPLASLTKLFAGLKGRNNRDNFIKISEARTIYKATSDGSYSNSRPRYLCWKKMLYAGWVVRVVRSCDQGLEVLAHRLSLYRQTDSKMLNKLLIFFLLQLWTFGTHRHRTYIMGRDWKTLTALRFVTVPSWKKEMNVPWYVKDACSENTLRKALSKFRNDQAATNSSDKITLKAGDSDGKHHTYVTPMTWGWSPAIFFSLYRCICVVIYFTTAGRTPE